MSKYIQLKNQIEKLQKEAELLRRKERSEAIARVKEVIAAFQLTSQDIGLSRSETKSKNNKSFAKIKYKRNASGDNLSSKTADVDRRSFVAPKYKDSASGATWTGRGKKPNWLVAALNSGKKLEDFRI